MSQTTAYDRIRAEVAVAVRAGIPRRDIIARFKGQASLASLYGWVHDAAVGKVVDVVAGVPKGLAYPVAPILDPPTAAGGIAYLERLQDNLRRLDVMMTMAEREGKIHNYRLAMECVKEIGVQLTRAARISADIQDMEAQKLFLRDLADVIYRLEPNIRDKIVAEMRALGHGGVL